MRRAWAFARRSLEILHCVRRNSTRCAYENGRRESFIPEESLQRKGKLPVYSYEQRKQILEACRYVDKVYPHRACEDLAICNELGATVQFVGSDWKGTELYNKMEKEYAAQGKRIMYTEYTKGISSTQVRSKILDK